MSAEEYPGCADLINSYSEVSLIARPKSLVGRETARALAKSDVLVVDETTLAMDGLQAVQKVLSEYDGLNILLVYEKINNNKILEYLTIGVRGLIERKSCVSLLRRAIPALYAGEVWMPRGLVQSLKHQSTINGSTSTWEGLPGHGKLN